MSPIHYNLENPMEQNQNTKNISYSSTHVHKNGDSIHISMKNFHYNPEIKNYQTKVYPHTVNYTRKTDLNSSTGVERDNISVESAYNMGTEICSWTFIPDRIQHAPIQSQLGWLAGVLETYGVIGKDSFVKGNRKNRNTNSSTYCHKTTINLYLYEQQLSKCDDLFIKFVKNVGLFTKLYNGLNTSRPGLQIYGDLLYNMPWKIWKDILTLKSTVSSPPSPTKQRASLITSKGDYETHKYGDPPGLTQIHHDSDGNNWSTNIIIEGNEHENSNDNFLLLELKLNCPSNRHY